MTSRFAAASVASVFVEIKNVKQERDAGRRRWFEADGCDLVVWFDRAERIIGFQLCYDLGRGDHALTWRQETGFEHSRIDAGEDSALKNQTPILQPGGAVPWDALRRIFEEKSAPLDAALRELVAVQLAAGAKQAGSAGRAR